MVLKSFQGYPQGPAIQYRSSGFRKLPKFRQGVERFPRLPKAFERLRRFPKVSEGFQSSQQFPKVSEGISIPGSDRDSDFRGLPQVPRRVRRLLNALKYLPSFPAFLRGPALLDQDLGLQTLPEVSQGFQQSYVGCFHDLICRSGVLRSPTFMVL